MPQGICNNQLQQSKQFGLQPLPIQGMVIDSKLVLTIGFCWFLICFQADTCLRMRVLPSMWVGLL